MYWAVKSDDEQLPYQAVMQPVCNWILDLKAIDLFEDLGTHDKSFQSPEGEEILSGPLQDCLGVFGPWLFVADGDNKEFETLDPLHYSPLMLMGACSTSG